MSVLESVVSKQVSASCGVHTVGHKHVGSSVANVSKEREQMKSRTRAMQLFHVQQSSTLAR